MLTGPTMNGGRPGLAIAPPFSFVPEGPVDAVAFVTGRCERVGVDGKDPVTVRARALESSAAKVIFIRVAR